MSLARHRRRLRIAPMKDRFIARFVARTQDLREKSGRSQSEMASLLNVPKERYQKWEIRSPLPHEHVALFCELVGCDINFLFTGRVTKKSLDHASGKVIRAFPKRQD